MTRVAYSIVATFSQTSAGVIQTVYWLEFVCLLNTCAFPYNDMYRNGWLVGK